MIGKHTFPNLGQVWPIFRCYGLFFEFWGGVNDKHQWQTLKHTSTSCKCPKKMIPYGMEIFHKDMLILDTLKAPFCSIFMKQHHFAGIFWNFEIVCSRQYICPVEMEETSSTPFPPCLKQPHPPFVQTTLGPDLDRSAPRNLRHKKELGPRITPYANRSRNIIWYYTLYHGNQKSNIQTRNKSHWLSHRQIVDASLLSVLVYQKINFEKEHADMARCK